MLQAYYLVVFEGRAEKWLIRQKHFTHEMLDQVNCHNSGNGPDPYVIWDLSRALRLGLALDNVPDNVLIIGVLSVVSRE